ncbi:MAG: DUF3352 domain-containing protein [Candidatus Omnitrophota bacterium]|nr:DUF3352 domain-containing protein [Candidatus Omnitrophota bacterium]MDZ4243050.1 DUF3352 domain-containing protein [Candidatus Omnitrophota bacterium]
MKKILIAVLVLAALGTGGYFAYVSRTPQDKAVTLEQVLPSGPLVYVHFKDVERNWEKFTATPFGMKLSTIDWKKAMEQGGASAGQMQSVNQLADQLFSEDSLRMLKQFFGEEFAVAVYPVQVKSFGLEMFEEIPKSFCLVTRLKPELQFAEFVSRFFGRFGRSVNTETISYNNHTITKVATDNKAFAIYYVRVKDYLVFGFGDRAAKAVVDVMAKTAAPLEQDPMFLTAKARFLPQAQTVSFVNIEAIFRFVKEQAELFASANPVVAGPMLQQVESSFRQVKGFQVFGYSMIVDSLSRLKIDVHYKPEDLDPLYRELYNCPPARNRTLEFVPQDAMIYQWNNCYKLSTYWQQMKDEMSRAPASGNGETPAQVVAGIEQILGVSVEDDLLPAFGDEIGGFVQGVDFGEGLPVPKGAVFVKVADRAKADAVLSRLIQGQPMIQLQSEKYQDIPVNYFVIPMLPSSTPVAPAYGVLGDYLLIATDRSVLHQAIDMTKIPGGLFTNNPEFQKVNFGLTEPSNAVVFLSVAQMAQTGEKFFAWARKWKSSQSEKMEAFKTGQQQRLSDLQAGIEQKKQDLLALESQAGDAAQAAEPDVLKQQIETTRRDIETDESRVQDIERFLEEYEAGPMSAQDEVAAMESYVNPILGALRQVPAVSSRTVIREKAMENITYIRLE